MESFPVNLVDLGVIAVVLLSAVLAFARGFVREVLSVAGWVGAAFVTLYGFPHLRPHVHALISSDLVADVVTGAGLFIASLVILSVISHAIARRVQESSLGAVDRSLGFLFGAVRGGVIVCLAWLLLAWLMPVQDHPQAVREARTLPLVMRGSAMLAALVPDQYRQTGATAIDDAGRAAREEAERQLPALISPPPRAAQEAGERPGYSDSERTDMDRVFEQIR